MDVPLVGKLTTRLFACTAIVLSAGCSPSGDTDLRQSADDQADKYSQEGGDECLAADQTECDQGYGEEHRG